MTLTLTGINGYALQEALGQVTAEFIGKYGDLAVERIDGEEVEFVKIQEALTSLPFLADKKLVILRAPSKNKKFVEQSEQLLAAVPETNDVILVEPRLDKRLSYYKFLKKYTDYQEFLELDNNGLVQWLLKASKERGGMLGPRDARYLVERVGANQQLLANELDKLLLYEPKVSRQTIDLLTDPTPQSTIFQLLEAAFSGKTEQTLQLYQEQRALKVEPQQIIAMLAWQLHILAIIKTAAGHPMQQIAEESKINIFVIRKSQSIADRLSLAELKRLVSSLTRIDIRMKRSAIDADEALQYYLLTLAG